ncbi:MAG TPA: hypothetical protein PKK60_00035 [archaeon]|nr:hypothetical protein [archaeon]
MFGDLINIALFKKDLKEVSREVTMGSGFFNYIAVLVIVLIVSLIISFLSQISAGVGFGTPIQAILGAIIGTIVSVIILGIFLIPGVIVISVIYFAIVNVIAKMLGGKGDFRKTTAILWTVGASVLLTYSLGLQIITGILQFLLGFLGTAGIMILGLISIVLIPVYLAIAIISLYLESKAVGAAHNISTIRGFAALIIPGLVIFLVFLVLGLLLMIVLGAAFFSIAGSAITSPTGYFGLM